MKSKKTKIITTILLIAVVLCIGGVILYLDNRDKSSDEEKRAIFEPALSSLNDLKPLLEEVSGREWVSDTDTRFCEHRLSGFVRDSELSCYNRIESTLSSANQSELETLIKNIRSKVDSHPYFSSMNKTLSNNPYPQRSSPTSQDDGLNYVEGTFSSNTEYQNSDVVCNLSFIIYGTEAEPNLAKETKSILSCEV